MEIQGWEEFKEDVERFKEGVEKLGDEYLGLRGRYEDYKRRLIRLIERLRTPQSPGDPPEIGEVKRILEKLKHLIPERGPLPELKNRLNMLLENLNPEDQEDLSRLLEFIEKVYLPALDISWKYAEEESRVESASKRLGAMLEKLIKIKIEELEKKLGQNSSPP